MSLYILPSGTTEVLWFDVCPNGEQITFPAEITDHPIEKAKSASGDGLIVDSITDHTLIRPIEFSIKGFVSNTPTTRDRFTNRGVEGLFTIQVPGPRIVTPATASFNPATLTATINQTVTDGPEISASADGFNFPAMNRVREMILALNRLRNASKLVAIVTRDLRWDSIGVGTWDYERTSGGANFTIECKQVATVENRRVTAPLPKEPRGLFNDQKGPQEPTDAPQGPKESTAFQALNFVKTLL